MYYLPGTGSACGVVMWLVSQAEQQQHQMGWWHHQHQVHQVRVCLLSINTLLIYKIAGFFVTLCKQHVNVAHQKCSLLTCLWNFGCGSGFLSTWPPLRPVWPLCKVPSASPQCSHLLSNAPFMRVGFQRREAGSVTSSVTKMSGMSGGGGGGGGGGCALSRTESGVLVRHKDESGNCASLQLWGLREHRQERSPRLTAPPAPYPSSLPPPPVCCSHLHLQIDFWGPSASLLLCKRFLHCSLIISVITPSLFSHVVFAKRRGPVQGETGPCSASQTDIWAGWKEGGRKRRKKILFPTCTHNRSGLIWPRKRKPTCAVNHLFNADALTRDFTAVAWGCVQTQAKVKGDGHRIEQNEKSGRRGERGGVKDEETELIQWRWRMKDKIPNQKSLYIVELVRERIKWYQKKVNHNKEINGLTEWTDCPCAAEQVHFLAGWKLEGLLGIHTGRRATLASAGSIQIKKKTFIQCWTEIHTEALENKVS